MKMIKRIIYAIRLARKDWTYDNEGGPVGFQSAWKVAKIIYP